MNNIKTIILFNAHEKTPFLTYVVKEMEED